MPKIIPLIKSAIDSAKLRGKLLFLLAVFAGLLTSLLYTPALLALETLLSAVTDSNTKNETDVADLSALITSQVPTLLVSYAGLMAIMSLLLPFWARAAHPVGLTPYDGSITNHLRRALQSFSHLISAALFTIMASTILLMLSSVLGVAVGGVIILFAVASALWLSIFFNATANRAIIAASTDQKTTFSQAMIQIKAFLRPALATLAIIWVGSIVVNMVFEPVLGGILEGTAKLRSIAFIQGTFSFLTTALHISVLYHIPGLVRVDQEI